MVRLQEVVQLQDYDELELIKDPAEVGLSNPLPKPEMGVQKRVDLLSWGTASAAPPAVGQALKLNADPSDKGDCVDTLSHLSHHQACRVRRGGGGGIIYTVFCISF